MNFKRVIKIFKYLILCLAILFVVLLIAVNLPFSQRFISEKANRFFSKKNLPVQVEKITLQITGKIGITNIQIVKDPADTIVYAKQIKASVRIFPLLRRNVIVKSLTINDATVNIKADSVTGVPDLISIFTNGENTDKKPEGKQGKKWNIGINSVNLKNVRFSYHDHFRGILIFESLRKLSVDFVSFSIANHQISAGHLDLESAIGGIDLNNPGKKSQSKTSNKPGDSWKFILSRSDLKNIQFTLHQSDKKQRMEFAIIEGNISNAGINLSDQRIAFEEVNLEEPDVHLFITPSPLKSTSSKGTGRSGFPGSWKISGSKVTIADGSFHKDDYSGQTDTNLVYQVANLSTTIKGIRLDSLESGFKMNQLSLALENGFNIENGEITFNSDSARNSSLDLNLSTATSRIKLEMKASEKLPGIIRDYYTVPFSLVIEDSKVSAFDFLTLLPVFKGHSKFKKHENFTLGINCNISGTSGLLKIENLNLHTSSGVSIITSGQVKDLSNPLSARLSLSLTAEGITKSRLEELFKLAGSSSEIPEFEPVMLAGTIDSTLSKPYFTVSVKSNSGDIDLGGSLDLSHKIYNLKVAYSGIEIGKLLEVSDIGRVSGNLDLNGEGFEPDRMRLKASIEIDTAVYKEYDYKNIKLHLDGDRGIYSFGVDAADPALKSNLTGELRLSDSQSGGRIAGLFSLDAGRVNLYKEATASGGIEASLDHSTGILNGSVSLKNIVISKDNKTENLKSAVLSFHSSDTLLSGKIESDFLNVNANYDGSLEDLKRALNEGRVKSSAIADSAFGNRIPYFSALSEMKVSVESTYDPIISLFLSDSVFNYNRVSLAFMKDSTGTGKADLSVDRFNIGKTRGFGAELQFENYPDGSLLKISADSITSGRITLTGINTGITAGGDTANYNLKANSRNDSIIYDIKGIAFRSEGEIKLRSAQNLWVINGITWDISPGDFLVLDPQKNDLTTNIHLKNGNRTIDIFGKKSERIFFECRNVWLSQLIIPGMYTYRYDGELTGKVNYTGSNGRREIGADMGIRQINMGGSLLGDLKISGNYLSDTTGTIEADLNAIMNDSSTITLGIRSGKNSGKKSFKSEFSGIQLNTFEPLVSRYVSGLRGVVDGNLSLSSDGGEEQLDGSVKINNTTLKFIPLNARFYVADDVIKIEKNILKFSRFTVQDSMRSPLTLNGSVDLSDPGNILADLQLTSDHIQVMNTTSKDNAVFNGIIFINSRLNLKGPLQKPSINGNIVLADGTVINYNYTENLSVSETQKTLTFATLKQDQQAEVKAIPASGQLSRTPDIEATVEIDPRSLFNFQITRGFDIGVSITGGGFLTYSLMPNKEIDLSGIYEISQGSSQLKIPGWPRKDFVISKGSIVKWDGKIDDPDLNIETTSKVRGSYVNPVDNKTREVSFLVYMKLAGRFSELEIIFDVRSEDQYITTFFNTLSADERMRQAVNLLIFERVELPGQTSSSDYLTQQISQFWESQLNQITKSATKKIDLDVSVGLDTYTRSTTTGEQTTTSLSYQVKKDMFHERGSVLLSGHTNYNTTASQQTNAVIENFIFEYALDTNRTKFLKVYRQQNYEDLLEGEVIKSGVGFIYRKNYDRISDIWRRQKKVKK